MEDDVIDIPAKGAAAASNDTVPQEGKAAPNDLQQNGGPWILTELENVDSIKQPLRSSTRVKFTCLSLSRSLLALGTNTGGVYVYGKRDLKYIDLITDEKNACSISKIALSPSSRLICIAYSDGILNIYHTKKGKKNKLNRVRSINHHKGSLLTALLWNKEETRLYAGDNKGLVTLANFASSKVKTLVQMSSEILMRLDSPVIQLDAQRNRLLVSTQTKTYLCYTDKEKFVQIGKKPRDGVFGSCFLSHTGDEKLRAYCARPGSRLWETDDEGQVVSTHLFKKLLDIPPSPLVSSSDICITGENPGPQGVNFPKLLQFLDVYLVTWGESGLYLLNPVSDTVFLWTNEVTDVADGICDGKDIYLLTKEAVLRKIKVLTVAETVQTLYEKGQIDSCVKLIKMFYTQIDSDQGVEHFTMPMLQDMKEKIKTQEDPSLVEWINEIEEKINEEMKKLESGEKVYVRMASGIYKVKSRSQKDDNLSSESQSISSYDLDSGKDADDSSSVSSLSTISSAELLTLGDGSWNTGIAENASVSGTEVLKIETEKCQGQEKDGNIGPETVSSSPGVSFYEKNAALISDCVSAPVGSTSMTTKFVSITDNNNTAQVSDKNCSIENKGADSISVENGDNLILNYMPCNQQSHGTDAGNNTAETAFITNTECEAKGSDPNISAAVLAEAENSSVDFAPWPSGMHRSHSSSEVDTKVYLTSSLSLDGATLQEEDDQVASLSASVSVTSINRRRKKMSRIVELDGKSAGKTGTKPKIRRQASDSFLSVRGAEVNMDKIPLIDMSIKKEAESPVATTDGASDDSNGNAGQSETNLQNKLASVKSKLANVMVEKAVAMKNKMPKKAKTLIQALKDKRNQPGMETEKPPKVGEQEKIPEAAPVQEIPPQLNQEEENPYFEAFENCTKETSLKLAHIKDINTTKRMLTEWMVMLHKVTEHVTVNRMQADTKYVCTKCVQDFSRHTHIDNKSVNSDQSSCENNIDPKDKGHLERSGSSQGHEHANVISKSPSTLQDGSTSDAEKGSDLHSSKVIKINEVSGGTDSEQCDLDLPDGPSGVSVRDVDFHTMISSSDTEEDAGIEMTTKGQSPIGQGEKHDQGHHKQIQELKLDKGDVVDLNKDDTMNVIREEHLNVASTDREAQRRSAPNFGQSIINDDHLATRRNYLVQNQVCECCRWTTETDKNMTVVAVNNINPLQLTGDLFTQTQLLAMCCIRENVTNDLPLLVTTECAYDKGTPINVTSQELSRGHRDGDKKETGSGAQLVPMETKAAAVTTETYSDECNTNDPLSPKDGETSWEVDSNTKENIEGSPTSEHVSAKLDSLEQTLRNPMASPQMCATEAENLNGEADDKLANVKGPTGEVREENFHRSLDLQESPTDMTEYSSGEQMNDTEDQGEHSRDYGKVKERPDQGQVQHSSDTAKSKEGSGQFQGIHSRNKVKVKGSSGQGQEGHSDNILSDKERDENHTVIESKYSEKEYEENHAENDGIHVHSSCVLLMHYWFLFQSEDVLKVILEKEGALRQQLWQAWVICNLVCDEDESVDQHLEAKKFDQAVHHLRLQSLQGKLKTFQLMRLYLEKPDDTVEFTTCLDLSPLEVWLMCRTADNSHDRFYHYLTQAYSAKISSDRHAWAQILCSDHELMTFSLDLLLQHGRPADDLPLACACGMPLPSSHHVTWRNHALLDLILSEWGSSHMAYAVDICHKYRYWTGYVKCLPERSLERVDTALQLADLSILSQEEDVWSLLIQRKSEQEKRTRETKTGPSCIKCHEPLSVHWCQGQTSVTWERLATLLVSSGDITLATRLLQQADLPHGALPKAFYQTCLCRALSLVDVN